MTRKFESIILVPPDLAPPQQNRGVLLLGGIGDAFSVISTYNKLLPPGIDSLESKLKMFSLVHDMHDQIDNLRSYQSPPEHIET